MPSTLLSIFTLLLPTLHLKETCTGIPDNFIYSRLSKSKALFRPVITSP